MGRTVAIGIQNFNEIIEENYFYIDKTAFIKDWWESGDSVTLITRPRRFGKTLNMSMLEQFFSINYAGRDDLFEGLSIWEEEKYRKLQGTYPVISLSFADIKRTDYRSVREEINYILVSLYRQNRFLLESKILSETDKQFFESITMEMSDVTATRAVQRMCEFLYRYYGKKVIVLLDEYDTPMQEAYVNGFWEELVAFTRSMFNSTFKTNPYLARAVMTGITRVSKESIFSDLNNLKVVTTTSDEYATSFGFTEEEVFAGLKECGLENEMEKVKYWYDGFVFGSHRDIYNPWSVLNFLDTGKLGTYWANTSSNSLAGKLIKEGSKKIKTTFEVLIKDGIICCPIDEQIVYNQLNKKENAIWSLLLASGYLKVISKEKDEEVTTGGFPMYELTLTNNEVKRMFLQMINGWFEETEDSYSEFISAMLLDNRKAMNVYMNRVARDIFSYFDTGRRPSEQEPERFYHGFVLGLIAELYGRYTVTSNRESGFGRYDVMLEPKRKEDDAIILEFKVHDPEDEETLKDTVASALAQIEEKQYESVLIAKGIEKERIRKYGFAFEGKKVLIG